MDQEKLDSLLDDGKRKFEIEFGKDDVRTFFLVQPTAADVRDAEWESIKSYNKALKAGLFTKSEMMDLLKKRNIIGPDYDQQGNSLQEKLQEKVIAMERATDRSERIGLVVEVNSARTAVVEWNQRLTVPMANTCEEYAQTEKVEFLACVLTVDSNGKRVWESLEQFKRERNIVLQTRARLEILLWIEGLGSDVFDALPERAVFSKVMTEISDEEEARKEEEAAAANKAVVDGEASLSEVVDLVVEEALPVEVVVEEKVKLKRGRRKAS